MAAAEAQMNIRRSVWNAALVLLGTLSLQPCFGADGPPATANAKPVERIEPPPPRTRTEVEAVLGKDAGKLPAAEQAKGLRPLHIVLVAGKKDHGKGEHDYPAWQAKWAPMLAKAPGVHVSTAFGRPDDKLWQSADVMVFYCWGPQFWDAESFKQLDPFLARGGGLVVMHSAVIGDADTQGLADRIGFAWDSKGTKYRHGAHDLNFTNNWPPKSDALAHPITRGYRMPLHVVDEDYWPILAKSQPQPYAKGTELPKVVLATTSDDGGEWPMLWTVEHGKGRVFCTMLGHYTWTLDDPLARALILRGIGWAAGEPVQRLEWLALDGVKLAESK
jgi:hypothetical protein